MSDLDSRLTAALEAEAPPERDPLFRIEVLARLERARFRRRLVLAAATAVVVAAIVVANARAIDAWVAMDPTRVLVVAAVAMAFVLAIPGLPIAATPGVRTVAKLFGRWFSG